MPLEKAKMLRGAWGCLVCASLLAFCARAAAGQSVASARPTASPLTEGPSAPTPPAVMARDAEGRVTVRAVRLQQPIVLDGRLDEEMYQSVPAVLGFVQQEPHPGEAATQKTEAWVFFDDWNVYISFHCWLTEPDRLVANEMRRDDINIWYNDNVGVSLDTFYDHRSGVFFQTNALGGVRDGAVTDERNANYDYNTVFDVKSRRVEGGWTTEFQIPFKSLRYRRGRNQVWGLILQRVVRGKNELSYLTPMPASYGGGALFKYSSSAMLVGIEAPDNSRNLEVKPYVTSDLTTNRSAVPPRTNDLGANFGIDLKYGVTKSLTADFTYHTDFAQVEADDTQLNLTRFNQFFAEKREFFLEGQGIFNFGGVNPAVTGTNAGPGNVPVLFYSRSVGLENGLRVPITAGARLTGRAGRYTLGFLNIETDESDLTSTPAANLTAMRVKRDILRRSSIGLIATQRSPSGRAGNTAAGLDATLQFGQDVQINSYYARTKTPGRSGDPESYLGQFKYSADRYGVEVNRLKVGDAFNPEAGYLYRRNFQRTYGQLRFSPRPKRLPGIRKIGYEGSLDRFASGLGRLQSQQAFGTLRALLESGDEFNLNHSRNEEVIDAPFRISRGVLLPVGDYRFHETRANYVLGPQRRMTGTATLSLGSFYDGDKREVGYTGRIGVTPHFTLEPRVSLNWVRLPEGDFAARVISNRSTVAMTPRMFVVALLQYNSSVGSFSSNLRFRWEYQPGSDVFVVYSDGRDTTGSRFPVLVNRQFVAKFTRLVRF